MGTFRGIHSSTTTISPSIFSPNHLWVMAISLSEVSWRLCDVWHSSSAWVSIIVLTWHIYRCKWHGENNGETEGRDTKRGGKSVSARYFDTFQTRFMAARLAIGWSWLFVRFVGSSSRSSSRSMPAYVSVRYYISCSVHSARSRQMYLPDTCHKEHPAQCKKVSRTLDIEMALPTGTI